MLVNGQLKKKDPCRPSSIERSRSCVMRNIRLHHVGNSATIPDFNTPAVAPCDVGCNVRLCMAASSSLGPGPSQASLNMSVAPVMGYE